MANTAKVLESRQRKERDKLRRYEEACEQILPRREAMRIPEDSVRFCRKGNGRCNGQKPKYKDVRRGLGRPTVNIMLF